ncbi:MAG: Unknown protein [uncultured Sulfurovum sp.]|uniref:DUF4276 family protein n=1 Tax=uncultured Sulfurovum sp. TaxID=269237 RepID=A0A6S6SKH2_9BACT|nr:MAG: Unknown protein [uncultured Sulfurovum sp.]
MVAILHEGSAKKTADNELLKLLIEKLELNIKEIRFFGLGGKSNFFKEDYRAYKELLTEINEGAFSKILFVIDADYKENDTKYGGFDNTLKEMIHLRKKLNIYEISDLYITCNFDTKEGYLESLILSSIPSTQKECIETFLDCSEFKSKENDKAILNQIYNNAYPNAPYDFSSDKFDTLKQKLQNLFKGE